MKVSDFKDTNLMDKLNLSNLDKNLKVNDSSDVSLSNTDESIESRKVSAIYHDENKDQIGRFYLKVKRKKVKRSKPKIKKKDTSSNWISNKRTTIIQKSQKTSSAQVNLLGIRSILCLYNLN